METFIRVNSEMVTDTVKEYTIIRAKTSRLISIEKWVIQFSHGNSFDCNRFEGEWKNDKKNGHGVMKFHNGDVYEGEWIDGHKNGRGSYSLANGDSYEGYIVNDKKQGRGIYKWKNNMKVRIVHFVKSYSSEHLLKWVN